LLIGLALIFITGLIWGGVGVMCSYAARKKVDAVAMWTVCSLIFCAVSWAVFPDYALLRAGAAPKLASLAVVMLATGAFGCAGMLAIYRAMRSGHHGMVWTIAQCALVFPYVAGMVLFREPFVLHKAIGVAALLVCIAVLGYARRGLADREQDSGATWFLVALAALVLLGLQQTLTTVPSHWPGWRDAANMRIPLSALGAALAYSVVFLLRWRAPSPLAVVLGILSAATCVASRITLFAGLDCLSQCRMVSIAYPVAIGTCIVSFGLYSLLVLREPATKLQGAGMALGVVGLVLLSV